MYFWTHSITSSIQNSWPSIWLFNITFVFLIFIFKPPFWISLCNYKIICYNLSGNSPIQIISSANLWLLRYSPFICIPASSHFRFLKTSSKSTVNSLGGIVSPCWTPFCISIISLTLCSFIVAVISLFMFYNIFTYFLYPLSPESFDNCWSFYWAMHSSLVYSVYFSTTWLITRMWSVVE